MAILYGTQSNGETLPVLVDQFGNLVAKGIEGQPGQPGQPGEQGPPGPEGPPGELELPPDPYEGALLGWENGELAWVSTAVPLPAGTYGPFTYDSVGGILTVPQDVSLINGQQIFMSDNLGANDFYMPQTSIITNVSGNVLTTLDDTDYEFFKAGQGISAQVFSDNATTTANGGVWGNVRNMFDADAKNYSHSNSDGLDTTVTQIFAPALPCEVAVQVFAGITGMGDTGTISINNETPVPMNVSSTTATTYSDFTEVPYRGDISSITLKRNGTQNLGLLIYGYRVDGIRLYDNNVLTTESVNPAASSLTLNGGLWQGADGTGDPVGDTQITSGRLQGLGSVSLATGNQIVLGENNGNWIDGFYVTAPAQLIAARKALIAATRRRKK